MLLEVCRRHTRLDHEEVGDSSDTCYALYDLFCKSFLVAVVDLALECHPAIADSHLYSVSRNICFPPEGVDHGFGKVDIGAFGRAGQAHLDVVDYCLDATNAVSGFLGSDFFEVRIDPAGQRDDAILDSHTDFVGPDARIPFQFFQDVSLDFFIRTDANRHVACLLSIVCYFAAFLLPGKEPGSLITVFVLNVPSRSTSSSKGR